MESYAGGSIAVICTSMLRKGEVKESTLQSAADNLFRCNDVLRTRIHVNGPEVTQYIIDYTEQASEILHFSSTKELTQYAQTYARIPICLSGSLCEIKILILPEQYGILVKIHHLIADAWTMAFLATQFDMLLDGIIPPCHSYERYYQIESSYLNSKRYLQDRRFFLNQIEQCNSSVFIRNPDTTEFSSKRKTFLIPQSAVKKILDFSKKNNYSVFSLFTTALASYISRITENAENFFVGTTVLNRMNEQEMNTSGMFVNTVPLLLSVKSDNSFLENLENTEDAIMSVFRHQRYNYGDLLRDAKDHLPNGGRLFDVMLNYINASVSQKQSGIEYVWYHNGMQTESLQIHFDDRNQNGIFHVNYDYQIAKFSKEEIILMHSHIMNLLFDGIRQPEKKLSELKLLSPAEEQSLRSDYNNTSVTYPISENSSIFSLFEENAKKYANRTCITADHHSICYKELLSFSESIDNVIRTLTNNQKSVVAVIAERSVSMYCAVYGIIRGGNAYLPISPEDPQERIDFILENSGVSLVIAQEQFVHLVKNTQCVNIAELIKNPSDSKEKLPCAALPEDTAYVIYTSGSTGTPKGVRISHKSVINRILWMNTTYPLNENSVILQKTPYTFDVSVWELFWWGMCSGSLAASNPGEHAIPSKILNAVYQNKVSHLHFVPSVFDIFLGYLEKHKEEQDKFSSVKHVFLSGEALDSALVHRFYALYDYQNVHLHNLYGPTECTVDVTYYDCKPTDKEVPIGIPINNTKIYITDKYLNLMPVGIKGELLVGGQNVGQGYLNAPQLTEEKFITNPFDDGFLYKTGDLAYRRQDGQIIFCGRADSQVKINGQRIELSEIESTIKAVPEVESSAVIMSKINDKDTLIAYYCSNKHLDDEIRTICENKLPRCMVPKQIHKIDQLPLHSNGKLDRKRLEQMKPECSHSDFIEPPTDILEEHICQVFQSVLSQSSINRHSDFFSLGGTSLTAILFLTELGYDHITPAQFIKNSTPAKLARLLSHQKRMQTNYVETLYASPTSRNAFVLFPFAGGNAHAYINLSNSLKKLNEDISIYYVRFLHSDAECKAAAEEIEQLLGNCNVSFYAHCAGSAVALKIVQFLEKKQQHFVRQCILGASIPFRTFKNINGWRYVPDWILKKILIKAGATAKALNSDNISYILKEFREDTDFAIQVFADKQTRINCEISIITGRYDLFTKFSRHPERQWKEYAANITRIDCINTSTHYFQTENSDLLAQFILTE